MIDLTRISNRIVLAGAGISSDFGGFLGNQIWYWLFNNSDIQGNVYLMNIMKTNIIDSSQYRMNYEKLYDVVTLKESYFLDSIASERDKETFIGSLNNLFLRMDENILSYGLFRQYKAKFKKLFFAQVNSKGDRNKYSLNLLFTLNQDMLWERTIVDGYKVAGLNTDSDKKHKSIAGSIYDGNKHQLMFSKSTLSNLDNNITYEGLNYVKLHGSLNWKDNDNNKLLITGIKKNYDHPLIKSNIGMFRDILDKTKNGKVMIIGYSFGDQIINDALLTGIKNGFKLHILNPKNINELFALCEQKKFLAGIEKYYPLKFIEIFDDSNKVYFDDIIDSFYA